MTGLKLLLAFSLLGGVFAQECDLGDFDIGEFSDKVTVTNASVGASALVMVTFDHGNVSWRIPPGGARTASGLLATSFSVTVLAPSSSRWNSYQERLVEARDVLRDLSLQPGATADEITNAAAELVLVVGALDQLQGNDFLQTCSAPMTGADGHATVKSAQASSGTWFWTLDCG